MKLVTRFIDELARLNHNLEQLLDILADVRTMAAPWLGWKVKDEPAEDEPRRGKRF